MGFNGVIGLPQYILPPRKRKKVASETLKVKQNWKRTVDGILAIGCSLLKIKEMLPHKNFVDHIQENFGLNEMGAGRFISVYRRFGRASSGKVLRSKVSVLYLLANSPDLDKVDRLARGGKIIVSGKRKSIDQLNVSDANKLRKTRYKEKNLTSRDLDVASASNAHRRLCTLAEEVADWCCEIERIKKRGLKINNVTLVKEYLHEVALAASSRSEDTVTRSGLVITAKAYRTLLRWAQSLREIGFICAGRKDVITQVFRVKNIDRESRVAFVPHTGQYRAIRSAVKRNGMAVRCEGHSHPHPNDTAKLTESMTYAYFR